MQVSRTAVLLIALGTQACWQSVSSNSVPGVYDVGDGYYREHRIALEKGGHVTETIVFSDGQIFTSEAQWIVEPLEGTAKTVRLKRIVAFGGAALLQDHSNLEKISHDAVLTVESNWGRVRMCEEGCELTYDGPGGKLIRAVYSKN
jgi:hypothetical protein